MNGKIATASRCKLLVGSDDVLTRTCSCQHPAQCYLTAAERDEHRGHPFVVRCRERNYQEYRDAVDAGKLA